MLWIVDDFGQREQFGTDAQASSLNRVHVDGEAHPVIFQIELDFAAALREILAFPDHKRACALQIIQNIRQEFVFPCTDENDLAGFQFPDIVDPSFHERPIVDIFSADDVIERAPKRVVSENADRNRSFFIREGVKRPVYKFCEVKQEGRLNLILDRWTVLRGR